MDEMDALLEGDDEVITPLADLYAQVFHTCRNPDGSYSARDGAEQDCPRCYPPGASAPLPELIGVEQRDELIEAGDKTPYYCVSATTGGLVTRGDRPVFATLAEWASVGKALKPAAYLPAITTGKRGTAGPLFGSLPLMDRGGAPDLIKRVCDLTVFLEKGAAMLAERVGDIDQQLAGRVHERELLARAAAFIDPDIAPVGFTTEARLDWLAKWREVVAR